METEEVLRAEHEVVFEDVVTEVVQPSLRRTTEDFEAGVELERTTVVRIQHVTVVNAEDPEDEEDLNVTVGRVSLHLSLEVEMLRHFRSIDLKRVFVVKQLQQQPQQNIPTALILL